MQKLRLFIAVILLGFTGVCFSSEVTVVSHPLVQHKLTIMRQKETGPLEFRRLLREISAFLLYESTRNLSVEPISIETPVSPCTMPTLSGKKLCLASILRAGNGLLEGVLELVPAAKVAHLGFYRDPQTLKAVQYYAKMPTEMENRDVLIVDPMLATGNTAIAAISLLKESSPLSIRFMCLVAAPEGIKNLQKAHPDVDIITAAVDSHLNEKGYIVPGLGDAGDRIYGTR